MASLGELNTTSQHLSDAAATLSETIRRFRVKGNGPVTSRLRAGIR